MKYPFVDSLALEGKSVFLRLDLNVPRNEKGELTDLTRIERSLPIIRHVLKFTNRIVLASHLGRPKGKKDPKYSLEAVGFKLAEMLNIEVAFVKDYLKAPVDQLLQHLGKNRIILLENLRFHNGETENDAEFAKVLAKGIDFYIDDAFGAMHRAHASVAALPDLFPQGRKALGHLVRSELEALDQLKTQAKAPFTVVLGGSKVSDKIGVLLNLMNSCNNILIGGAMAYAFLKYQGKSVGNSLCEANAERMIESILSNAQARKVKIIVPEDHIGAQNFEDAEGTLFTDEIPEGFMGLDIGPRTLERFKAVIGSSKTVFWNGPLGVFEKQAFSRGTFGVAEAIAKIDAFSVVGGGDTIAAVNQAGVAHKMSHISTGGGASLEYLEGRPLPGLSSLL